MSTEQEQFGEPWAVTNGNLIRIHAKGSTQSICGMHLRGKWTGTDPDPRATALATARRIVACVNALRGIDNPEAWVAEMRATSSKEPPR